MLPSHVTFFVDSSVAVTYPGGELFAGKDVVARLSPEGSVLGTKLTEAREEKKASQTETVQLFLNFPGVSQTRFEAAEKAFVSRLESESSVDSLRASWHPGKIGLSIWLRFARQDHGEDEIEERVGALVESFDLFDENDPNVIQDEELGTWFWNGSSKRWEAEVHLIDEQQQPVSDTELSVDSDSREGDISSQLQTVKRFLQDIDSHYDRLHAAIADELLENHNRNWSEEEPKNRDEFLSQIRLTSVDCQPDGSLTCYFSPGELFSDHVIEVRLDPSGDVVLVTLAG
jgi:hypothetical protein